MDIKKGQDSNRKIRNPLNQRFFLSVLLFGKMAGALTNSAFYLKPNDYEWKQSLSTYAEGTVCEKWVAIFKAENIILD